MATYDNFDDYKTGTGVSTAVNTTDDAYIVLERTRSDMPPGWTQYIHPQGWAYFRNDEFKLVVDEDIHQPEILASVNEYCLANQASNLPDGLEACLLGSAGSYFYLIIDHTQCLAEHAVAKPLKDWVGSEDVSISNLLRRRRLYWNFVQGHPSHMTMPHRALTEAIDSVRAYYFGIVQYHAVHVKRTQACTDNLMFGERSVVPFSKVESDDLLRHLEVPQGATIRETSMVVLVAWILREVYSYRHADGYGKYTFNQLRTHRRTSASPAYVSNSPSIVASTLLRLLINGPFFGIPQTYLEHIQHASEFRGRLSSLHQSWKEYTDQLVRGYSDFILISTVLLSATVGLLSVGDIAQIARVCSIMAAFASLGSIATGVFFVWRHQRDTQISTTRTFAYMNNAHRNTFGLPGHALFLSLPAVLLVWSLIGFTVAIVAYALQPISSDPATDVASTSVTIATFFAVLIFTALAIHVFGRMWRWESRLWTLKLLTRIRPDCLSRAKTRVSSEPFSAPSTGRPAGHHLDIPARSRQG
ncbi:uncharacterized protein B0H18DRAFT_18585 [Fomitopsis serialis]|uniref:uncharacterized protein n=1 Tax=Fomitopsis serialis TaxID=139415 RepID=UPI0020078555|nr:uncharacterized protein B0H18DRAFT_18585 [Neoantrodia serialis]KAH9938540.1 hypothetical protein B0H18DRAFT_18585 [Neoantrodia serialis]